ncbi:hypothetical protein Gohar_016897 [Gossypium harknessii]|uniref:Aminotransferase-like plant mobile domain-containing protein n=1 Tax=Gossypium harknessii TaxID=34285 RepID=A0A7J9G459_9ROSI|nr:hypothetical protein [Gossypium harknessii]
MAPQDLDDLHHIDLRERTDENWSMFHAQYINIWNNRYDFLPTREAIVVPELTCILQYISWFRIHGKPYLYGKRRQIAPMQELAPTTAPSMVAPPTGQYVPSYSSVYTNSIFFTQAPYIPPHFSTSTSMLGFVFGALSLMYYMPMPSTFSTTTYRPSMFQAPIESPLIMSSVYKTQYSYTLSLLVIQTPPRSLF